MRVAIELNFVGKFPIDISMNVLNDSVLEDMYLKTKFWSLNNNGIQMCNTGQNN